MPDDYSNPEAEQISATPAGPDPYGRYADDGRHAAAQEAGRQVMLRRLRMVLAGGLAAFCLVTWLLVRNDGALMGWLGFSGPSRVVRQHLEALSRGEAREAYSYFSPKYRGEIPLRAYEQLVRSHRAMFRTHVLSIASPAHSEDVTVLDFHLRASSGTLYLARFTLVRSGDQWWIDQVRWSEAPNPRSFSRV